MSRFKRILKRLAIGFALCAAVLLIAAVVLSWWAGHRLEQRLAVLRAAGEPTCLAELAPGPMPPEQDAAFHLERLVPEIEAFAKDLGDFFKTPLGQSFDERRDRGEAPTPEQIDFMRVVLELYPDLPHALEQAAACKGYASRVDFSLDDPNQFFETNNKPMQIFRSAARFLRWRIIVLLAEGKQEAAVKTGLVLLRLARLYEGEPLLVNHLVAIAVEGVAVEGLNLALRAGPVAEELRAELDQELALQDDPQRIVRVMKTERAYSMIVAGQLVGGMPWMAWWPNLWQADMIDYYDKLFPVIAQPWHESHQEIRNLNNFSHWSPISSTLIELLQPALQATREATSRGTAMLRCLRIVNALAAYAQENGHEASSLADLDLPEAATLDPFSGKPLKFKSTGDGWVVYSVYRNGDDDNGDFKEMADWGLGPAGYRVGE